MNCREFQEQVFEYCEGSLSPEQCAETDEHLGGCEICRSVLAEHRALAEALREGFLDTTQHLTFNQQARERIVTTLLSLKTPSRAPETAAPAQGMPVESGAVREHCAPLRDRVPLFTTRVPGGSGGLASAVAMALRPWLQILWRWRWAPAVALVVLLLAVTSRWFAARHPLIPGAHAADLRITVSARVPHVVTTYTFRREGRFVTDALVTKVQGVQEVLCAARISPGNPKNPIKPMSL